MASTDGEEKRLEERLRQFQKRRLALQQEEGKQAQPSEPAENQERDSAPADERQRRLLEQKELILQRHRALKQEEQAQAELPKPLIKVTVSGNRLEAEIEIQRAAEETANPTAEDIMAALKERGVAFGVNHAVIEQVSRQPAFGRSLQVARGKAPITGKDGYIKYLVRTERVLRPRDRGDGTVDYRDIGFIETVGKGQMLAEVVPAEKGIDGRDVFGNTIEGPLGKQPAVPTGKNTVYDEENHAIISEVDGSVEVVRGVINVQDMLRINGNVDLSTGDINFPGDVYVSGDVLSGFNLISKGSIVVTGTVEGARVEAATDISVGATINGMERGVVTAGGSVRCKYIHSCTLKTGGSIYADSIMHCNIEAGGSVELAGKRAIFVGGTAAIAGTLIAKTIGWDSHTPTVIEMAADFGNRESDLKSLKESLAALNSEQQSLTLLVSKLNDVLTRAGGLPAEQENALRKATARIEALDAERREIDEAAERIKKEREDQISGLSYIECSDRVHTGVKITFGNAVMVVKQSFVNSRVMVVDGEVKALSL